MFNQMEWGGYLLHELWPSQRVFFDGWTDFYGEPLTREYLKVAQMEPGWADVLERYDVGWVIFRTKSPLVGTLASSGAWSEVYRDDLATILIRRS
jgi:hypothetical protein